VIVTKPLNPKLATVTVALPDRPTSKTRFCGLTVIEQSGRTTMTMIVSERVIVPLLAVKVRL